MSDLWLTIQSKIIHKQFNCSRSGTFQCTARYENRILRAKPRILRKLHSRVSKTVSSSAVSTANTILRRHQPASRPPRSWLILRCLFLRCYLYRSLLPDFYKDGSDIERGNELQIDNYFGNSASKKCGDSNVCCTNESFWTLWPVVWTGQKENSTNGRKTG